VPRDDDQDGTPQGVFGAELRYHRERAGLSQTELAALVNISHDVISNPPHLYAVLDEGVLHRAISEPKVMHDQLMRVAEVSERPKMSIQVIPFTAGPRTGLLGAFVIATLDGDGSNVYLETATTGQVVEVPSATREAGLIFDNLRGEALHRTASRDLIMKVAQERWT
jgi:hypothetical protein